MELRSHCLLDALERSGQWHVRVQHSVGPGAADRGPDLVLQACDEFTIAVDDLLVAFDLFNDLPLYIDRGERDLEPGQVFQAKVRNIGCGVGVPFKEVKCVLSPKPESTEGVALQQPNGR